MASPWKKITNTPPFSVDTMPLLTDGSALNPVTPPSNAPNTLTFNCRFLLLPTGQVLYSNCTSDLQVFTPTGLPHSHWRPHISHVPRTLRRGHSYRVRGRQLNGMSQASGYGDDALRLRHGNQVHFCRTYDHSTMAVATGKKMVHTHFHVPNSAPVGHYELVVIANGIPSKPVKVHVKP